jgi:hypothetical protein
MRPEDETSESELIAKALQEISREITMKDWPKLFSRPRSVIPGRCEALWPYGPVSREYTDPALARIKPMLLPYL